MKSRLAKPAVVFALYAGLVVWLTWPLAAHVATHLPNTRAASRFDPLYMAWVLAHESRSLTTAPWRLLETNIYYPARHTLFYGDTGLGALPYFLPVFLGTGNPTLALNLVFLSGIVLTAWSLHVVVAAWTGWQGAGVTAACTFLATRWVLWDFVPTAPSFAVCQYFPWIVWLAATPAPSFARALRLWPLVVAQCLTDLIYVAGAVLISLAALALARVARRATRAAGLRLLGVLGLAGLALAPLYAGHVWVAATNPQLATQSLYATASRRLAAEWVPFATGPTTLSLSTAVLILGGTISVLIHRRRRPAAIRSAWIHGWLWTLTGFVMALPPVVSWHGEAIRLPLGLLIQWAPSVQVLRVFERLGVAMLVGSALLAGLAFAECARWRPAEKRGRLDLLRSWGLAVLVTSVLYWQYSRGVGTLEVPQPMPLPPAYPLARTITPDSPLMPILRAATGPLLEWPVGSGGKVVTPVFHARAMYRSIFHHRPLLNGYNSYWPRGFPERMALAARLPDPAALAALHRETQLEWILVVTREPRFDKVSRAPWLALAEEGGRPDLRLIARDGDNLLFRVSPDAPDPHRDGSSDSCRGGSQLGQTRMLGPTCITRASRGAMARG